MSKGIEKWETITGSIAFNSFIEQRLVGIEKKVTIYKYEEDPSIYAQLDFVDIPFRTKFDLVKKLNDEAVEIDLDYIFVVGK